MRSRIGAQAADPPDGRRGPRAGRSSATAAALGEGVAPNDLWRVDFKGEFQLGDRRLRHPLTVTDHASRYLLMCEALTSTREDTAFTAFAALREARSAPHHRSDNGAPFATANGLYGLSKLSNWRLRLGIGVERIKPGKPQQNGRHERMHLTLKRETTRPAAMNSLQPQARFDAFVAEFNTERPHEALALKTPAEVCAPSPRPCLPELAYPLHDRDILVANSGVISLSGRHVVISSVLAGQRLGLREVENDVRLVSFRRCDLAYIDLEAKSPQTIDTPFGTRASPMRSVQTVTYVSGPDTARAATPHARKRDINYFS